MYWTVQNKWLRMNQEHSGELKDRGSALIREVLLDTLVFLLIFVTLQLTTCQRKSLPLAASANWEISAVKIKGLFTWRVSSRVRLHVG